MHFYRVTTQRLVGLFESPPQIIRPVQRKTQAPSVVGPGVYELLFENMGKLVS
jgi:hypothetical protein